MTVDQFAEALRNPEKTGLEDDWYEARKTGLPGYKAHFCLFGEWYWYSVSNTTEKIPPSAVAEAITSDRRVIKRSGSYKDNGFEATVWVDDHAYMLALGNHKL